MFSFCECVSYGEIGGEAYASRWEGMLTGKAVMGGLNTGLGGCESKLADKAVGLNEVAIEEPNDSERFISGGERSEETVRRWLGV